MCACVLPSVSSTALSQSLLWVVLQWIFMISPPLITEYHKDSTFYSPDVFPKARALGTSSPVWGSRNFNRGGLMEDDWVRQESRRDYYTSYGVCCFIGPFCTRCFPFCFSAILWHSQVSFTNRLLSCCLDLLTIILWPK